MSTITIDASLKQVFLGLTEVAQIVDGEGHVLGIFKPQCQLDAELRAIAAKVFAAVRNCSPRPCACSPRTATPR